MNVNPYAPPQPPPPPPPPAWAAGSTGPLPWNATGAIARAWELYKSYAAVVTLALFVALLIGQIPGGVTQALVSSGVVPAHGTTFQVLNLSMSVLGWLVGAFFQGGTTLLTLKVARGEEPRFGDVFAGGRYFLPILAANFLMAIAIGLGLILLIVPGIIVMLALMLTPYYIVDQDLGALEALSASWNATKGQRGDLFVLALLSFLVILLGGAACCIGILAAIPVVNLATTVAYLHIAGRLPPPRPGDAGSPYEAGYMP